MNEDEATRDELIAWLESKRRHVVQQVEGMPADARRQFHVPSGWTPLGLVHHLTHDVERLWLRAVMAGEQVGMSSGYDGWIAPEGLEDEEIVGAYVAECRAATRAIAAMPLDRAPAWRTDDMPPYETLRDVLMHVLVETSTHAGHLDICRELADGGQRLVLDLPG